MMIKWVRNILLKTPESEISKFESTFKSLYDIGINNRDEAATKTYKLLESLSHETNESESNSLASEVNNIRYASNTNGFFHFFFPIVAHILFYKPQLESKILHQIIGPNFANGISDKISMIEMIQSAMKQMEIKNKNYITEEGKKWAIESLPKMEAEIEREIKKCKKELKQ